LVLELHSSSSLFPPSLFKDKPTEERERKKERKRREGLSFLLMANED